MIPPMQAVNVLPPIKSLKHAKAVAGSLSEPSKMPGYGYGISAEVCITGSKLAQIPGTVCHDCYALKGNYQWPGVKAAHVFRLSGLNHPQWVEAMVFMIGRTGTEYFRWHDSGDLQGVWHLEKICEVARQLPCVKFWLPTREKSFVREHQRSHNAPPGNLVIRVSSALVDGPPPAGFGNTSTVLSTGVASCPAPHQNNQCGACRQCWDPGVKNVSYQKH